MVDDKMISKMYILIAIILVALVFICIGFGYSIRNTDCDYEEICGDINDLCSAYDTGQYCIDYVINEGLEDEVCG